MIAAWHGIVKLSILQRDKNVSLVEHQGCGIEGKRLCVCLLLRWRKSTVHSDWLSVLKGIQVASYRLKRLYFGIYIFIHIHTYIKWHYRKKEATSGDGKGFEGWKGEILMIILKVLPLEKELLQHWKKKHCLYRCLIFFGQENSGLWALQPQGGAVGQARYSDVLVGGHRTQFFMKIQLLNFKYEWYQVFVH